MSSENTESPTTDRNGNGNGNGNSAHGAMASSAQAPHQSAAPNWERQMLSELVNSNLKEQRVARRWKVGLRLGWLFFWVVVMWQVLSHNQTSTTITAPHTALVNIKGEIADGSDASAENVVASMRAAMEDSGSQALVLLINSPGGSPVQAGIISDEIVRLKGIHQKPIYAVVEESCASAAYYIAASTDKIYVDKASIVGSIGVLMDGFGFTGLMDKLGVERRLMTAGDNKGFLDPFSPQTEAQRKHAQTMLNHIHSQFIAVVKKGRGDRLKENARDVQRLVLDRPASCRVGFGR
jgi:protease IV